MSCTSTRLPKLSPASTQLLTGWRLESSRGASIARSRQSAPWTLVLYTSTRRRAHAWIRCPTAARRTAASAGRRPRIRSGTGARKEWSHFRASAHNRGNRTNGGNEGRGSDRAIPGAGESAVRVRDLRSWQCRTPRLALRRSRPGETDLAAARAVCRSYGRRVLPRKAPAGCHADVDGTRLREHGDV